MKINRKERKTEEENENTILLCKCAILRSQRETIQIHKAKNETTNPKNQPMKTTNTLKLWAKQIGLTEKHYILSLLNTIGTSTNSQLPISSLGRQWCT